MTSKCSSDMSSASALKSLHVPGHPVILPNIWDIPSLQALLTLNTSDPGKSPVKAIATASYAIAASQGIPDENLTAEQNLSAIKVLAPLVRAAGLPLTVDLQDGYGSRIEELVTAAVEAGAVGANIEDSIPSAGFDKGIEGSLYSLEDQVPRLKAALEAAKRVRCPDFVLNARCDVFRLTPYPPAADPEMLKEAVRRGKAYLEAGATTVFYWGGSGRGLRDEEVKILVRELGGKVAVKLSDGVKEGGDLLSTSALAEMGVARVSVGPSLYLAAMKAVKENALKILEGGSLG